jgi:hypothetical protein
LIQRKYDAMGVELTAVVIIGHPSVRYYSVVYMGGNWNSVRSVRIFLVRYLISGVRSMNTMQRQSKD